MTDWGPRSVPLEVYDRLVTGIHSIMVLDGDNSARGYGFSKFPLVGLVFSTDPGVDPLCL